MAWTDDRVEILAKLWAEGLSASQIAKQLGGVTRNAVIGKVHRLGLSGRATPSRPRRKKVTAPRATAKSPATSRPSAPRTPKAPSAPTPSVKPLPIPLEAKPLANGEFATILTIDENTCKWPIGDPSSDDFRFCGRPASDNNPYCSSHCQVAYQPSRRRYGSSAKSIATPTRRHLN